MRILLVDDDFKSLKAIKRVIESEFPDYTIVPFDSAVTAYEQIHKSLFDLIISDYRMPEMDGITLLSKAKDIQPLAMRVILSGYSDKETLAGAINIAQVQRFIEKPYEREELTDLIRDILKQRVESFRIARG